MMDATVREMSASVKRMMVWTAAAMVAATCFGDGALPVQEGWRRDLKGTGQSVQIVPAAMKAPALAQAETYTVTFRAAVINAHGGGQFAALVDSIDLRSFGRQMMYRLCTNDAVAASRVQDNTANGPAVQGLVGELAAPPEKGIGDYRGIGSECATSDIRNGMFHRFTILRAPKGIRWWFDGDEMPPIDFAAGGNRRFAFYVYNADVEIAGFQAAVGDATERWECRNQFVNGGFEQLQGDFPLSWGTMGFGYEAMEWYGNLQEIRKRCRVEKNDVFEGRHAFRCGVIYEKHPGQYYFEAWRYRVPDTDWVFSCYLKNTVKGQRPMVYLEARDGYKVLAKRLVRPTDEWTRYEIPFRTPKSNGSINCGFELGGGTGDFLCDALQVERGTNATAYVERRCEWQDRPANLPKVRDYYMPESYKPLVRPQIPPRMAMVDPKRGSFRRPDGREFFMCGWVTETGWQGLDHFRKALDYFHDHGMNYYKTWSDGFPLDPKELKAMMDEVQKRDMMIGFYVAYDRKTMYPLEKQIAALVTVKDHPAFLNIDMLDECNGRLTAEKRMEIANQIRARFGNRIPIEFNEFDGGVISGMDYSACDSASGDFYVPGNHDLSYQYQTLEKLKLDNPDKVITYYPFASGHFSIWRRDATPTEILAQAYNGYALEVFNLKWWTAIPFEKGVPEAVSQARYELEQIDPSAFLDGTKAAVACQSKLDGVKFAAREKDGVLTIISINIYGEERGGVWTIPAGYADGEVLFEDQAIHVKDGTFRAFYGPYMRHVYRFRRADLRNR